MDNKPVKGDWNGAGMHTNFSRKKCGRRAPGWRLLRRQTEALSKKHAEHIALYYANLHERLDGAA
ncbi:MAG: hypothetical protein R3D66_05875 [Alphaproteobacteria bacterium]